jgi:hypothetical protein
MNPAPEAGGELTQMKGAKDVNVSDPVIWFLLIALVILVVTLVALGVYYLLWP